MMLPSFRSDWSDSDFQMWLLSSPSEDELRSAYLALEDKRSDLWRPGHIESYRRDRYELDDRYVRRLVRIKAALVAHWTRTGQVRIAEPA